MARTAVVAGTAAATVGAVSGHQQKKAMERQQEAAEDAQVAQSQQDIAAMQEQMAAMQAQQAQQSVAAAGPPPSAAGTDMMAQLNQLSQLHTQGVLNDEEFAAAKAKLLAG
jgi:hypothetical protein